MNYLSAATRIKLQRIIERKEDGGYPDDMLTQLECDRLRFHQWRLQQPCSCGFETEWCECIHDAADKIAH